LLQAQGRKLPDYEVVEVAGAAHEQVFHVSCKLESLNIQAQGSGSSKREAEQAAAEKILDSIEANKTQV
jgi:ribonuclease-3